MAPNFEFLVFNHEDITLDQGYGMIWHMMILTGKGLVSHCYFELLHLYKSAIGFKNWLH